MSSFFTFPVTTTNIFPLSNSKAGGQLVTEYNLRSLNTVSTPSAVEYSIGPSYTHSMADFEVTVDQDSIGSIISTSRLRISPGRAIINGHYVESLAPMVIDLLEENNRLSKSKTSKPLRGKLSVGIKAVYSTEATIAGSMKVENTKDIYEGLEVVILPEAEFFLPTDVPTEEQKNKVTAHIKLANFTFYDAVEHIENNADKIKYIEAQRIYNVTDMLDTTYVSKSLLDPKKLYVFAGKGTDSTGRDTWCDSLDSLIVWDSTPGTPTTVKPAFSQAAFGTQNGKTILALPHKQVDGMVNASGQAEYYPPRIMELPTADYGKNTSGTVDAKYTQNIKNIANRLSEFHQIVKGKQVYYIETKTTDTKLPPINSAWSVGDYVLVGQDASAGTLSDGVTPPSTMYVLLPGVVETIAFVEKRTDDVIPSSLSGVQLLELTAYEGVDSPPDSSGKIDGKLPTFFTDDDTVRGTKNSDYFVLTYYTGDELKVATKYYYKVTVARPREWSSFILLSSEIRLANEETVGGFYNVPVNSSAVSDAGYVYLDETGHLRLLDYGLLRSGTLAYQLGEDLELPKGLTLDELQTYLDDYVNDRIAFPTASHRAKGEIANLLNIYIDITEPESSGDTHDLYIRNIDSRFGTGVCLHLSGTATDSVTIHISDCERFKISSDLSYGGPKINLYRTCIYYDAAVLNYIRSCHLAKYEDETDDSFKGMKDISLWYERFEDSDANLAIDGMTVSEIDSPIISNDLDFWNAYSPNDNHYRYALKSITLSPEGEISGCRLLVCNDSTNNIESGEKLIFSKFKLPHGQEFSYPEMCLTSPIKVTGSFISSYYSTSSKVWVVSETWFTALSGTYNQYSGAQEEGTIAFKCNTSNITADLGTESVPGWESGTFHMFSGGVIS